MANIMKYSHSFTDFNNTTIPTPGGISGGDWRKYENRNIY